AVYMLWMYQRVMFGPIKHEENEKLVDLNFREIGLMVPLILFMVWIGVRPVDFLQYSEQQITEILETSRETSVAVRQRSAAADSELPEWASEFYDVTPELASTTGRNMQD
ncbi:MAG: Fe-S-binding domain-containing protein, partial [Balneolaceae bacterium]|nr:Fe-S-binding domain-containing protein [Balneolaceae bacterium]